MIKRLTQQLEQRRNHISSVITDISILMFLTSLVLVVQILNQSPF